MSARRQTFASTLTMTLWTLVAVSVAPPLQGQGVDRGGRISPNATVDTAKFLARARAGTSRYRDQDVAVADGYKPVGVEFPAMGTHWVHLGHILEDSLIAERPSVLIYVNVGGMAQLGGVAYTDLRTANEPPPSALSPGGWHEHNGTVAEESFPLAHDGSDHSTGMLDDPEMRLAV